MNKLNKKGFLADIESDFIAYFLFVLIFIGFFIFFSIKLGGCGAEKRIEYDLVGKSNSRLDQDMMLLNYLRMTVDVNGENMTMAELIAMSYQNDEYTLVQQKTLEFLDLMDTSIGGTGCAAIGIEINNRQVKRISINDFITDLVCIDSDKSEVRIPLPYQNSDVAVVWLSFSGEVVEFHVEPV